MIFYTADLHLGHKNVIKLCSRPFTSIEEMDAALIENWNLVVGKDDTVYILGDLSFRSVGSVKPVLKVLNGTKHLIIGNHDKSWMKNVRLEEFFATVSPLLEIDDGDTHITLCHYPMLSWNRVAHGAIHIHGHIHNNTNSLLAFLKT
jgi:calcineurin-like phosphoesterase family protein